MSQEPGFSQDIGTLNEHNLSLAGLPVVYLMPQLLIKNWRRVASIICSLLVGAGGITAARSRNTSLIKFRIKVVDSATGKPKSEFFLGETVSVVFTVTNQGRRPQTIANLHDTYISYTLVSTSENKDPETFETGIGGTAGMRKTPLGIIVTKDEDLPNGPHGQPLGR